MANATGSRSSSSPPSSSSTNNSPEHNNTTSHSTGTGTGKRRGTPSAGTASSSHVLRTTSTAAAAAAGNSTSSNNGGATTTTTTTGNNTSHSSNLNTAAGSGISSSNSSSSTLTTSSSSIVSTPSTAGNNGGSSGASGVMIAPPPRVAVPEGSVSVAGVNGSGGVDVASSHANGGAGSGSGTGPGSNVPGSSGNSIKSGYSLHRHHSNSISSSHSIHSIHSIHSMHSIQSHGNTGNGGGAGGGGSGNMGGGNAVSSALSPSSKLIKEKDSRIAQLQNDIAAMEDEFTRQLDKLSMSESQSTTYWQTKHSRLQQQMAASESTVRLLRAEVDLREAERTDLRAGWEEMRELRDEMQRAAASRDEEVRVLRDQVRGLKEWVSTSTRADGPVALSDEVFADGMARLANGLQNWVIVHFRRAKLDIDTDKTASEELLRLVPMYEELVHSSKLHLLQSVVSRLLVESVFDAYFVGLPPLHAAQLEEIQSYLQSLAGAAEPVNQWRALTLAIASKDSSQSLQAETNRVIDEVVGRVNGVLDAIADVQRTDARDQALRALVANAIDVSRQLKTQKAVFQVAMPEILPHQQVLFDPSIMEDIGGEEDDGLAQREIACVTFPGIIKLGDQTGGHLQYRNVICKARVLCAPE